VFLDGHLKELGILNSDATKGQVSGKYTLIARVEMRAPFFVHDFGQSDHFAVAIQDRKRQQRGCFVACYFVYVLIESSILQ
jgi:hypothetical protein